MRRRGCTRTSTGGSPAPSTSKPTKSSRRPYHRPLPSIGFAGVIIALLVQVSVLVVHHAVPVDCGFLVPPFPVGSSSAATSTLHALGGYLDDIDTSPVGVRRRVTTIKEPKDLLDFLAEDDRLCVVKVWAKWCRTCKVFDTRWRKVAQDESDVRDPGGNVLRPGRARFAEIEYTANEELCRGLNATKLPHVLMYKSMIKQAGFLSLPTGNFNHDVRALKDQVIEYSDRVVLPPQNVPPPPSLGRTAAGTAAQAAPATASAGVDSSSAASASSTVTPLPPPWLTPRGADAVVAGGGGGPSRPPGVAATGAAVPPSPPAWAVARTQPPPPVVGGGGGVGVDDAAAGDDDGLAAGEEDDDDIPSVLRAELDRTSEELLSTRQLLRKAQTDLTVANGAVADAERTVADYERVRAERDGLKEELRLLRLEAERTVEEATKLTREEAEAAIDAVRAEFEAEIAGVRTERDELASEVGRLVGELKLVREEAERTNETSARLEADAKLAKSAQFENELLKKDLFRVQEELEEAYEEVERGTNYTAELVADLEKAEKAAMEKESFEKDVAHLEEVLKLAQDELERSLNDTATLEAEAKQAVLEKEDLEERIHSAQEEAREAVMAKEALEKDLARLYGALKVSQEEMERNSMTAARDLDEAKSAHYMTMEDFQKDQARMEERLDLDREEAERLTAEADAAKLENDVLRKDLARLEDALKLAQKDARRESYGTAKLKAKLAEFEMEAELARTEKKTKLACGRAKGDSNTMDEGKADLGDAPKSPQIAGEACPIEEPRPGHEEAQRLRAEPDQVGTSAAQQLDFPEGLVGTEKNQELTTKLEADATKDREEVIPTESEVAGKPNRENPFFSKLGISEILQRRTMPEKKALKGKEQALPTKDDAATHVEGKSAFAWKVRRKVGMKKLVGRQSRNVGMIDTVLTRKKTRRR